jgi:uncharacterized RDD family membrane protein YckC
MQVTLDESVIERKTINVKYAGFWLRLGALFLDGLIMAPITFGLTFYNIFSWKSGAVMLLASLISVAYKPFMEASYGATLGKMVLKLKVTDLDFKQADVQTILLRNIFYIVPSVLIAFLSLGMYSDPDFGTISTYGEYTAFSQQFVATQFVSICSGLLTIVEAIMIGVDDQCRSLHDRIAGTYVIEKP